MSELTFGCDVGPFLIPETSVGCYLAVVCLAVVVSSGFELVYISAVIIHSHTVWCFCFLSISATRRVLYGLTAKRFAKTFLPDCDLKKMCRGLEHILLSLST